MNERITDEELSRLAEIANSHTGGIKMGQHNARLVFEELCERRAADARALSDGSSAVITMGSKSLDGMLVAERVAGLREGFELAVDSASLCHESTCLHENTESHLNWTEARQALEEHIAELRKVGAG